MRLFNSKHMTLLALPFLALFFGCQTMQVGGDIQKGRSQLLYGDPKIALGYFERAAALDPNYRLHDSAFPEGVWTYVGQAYLANGALPEAQKAFERASNRDDDNLAKLYLGIVLTRQRAQPQGFKEMEAGLQGLHEWYDWVRIYHIDGQFWDPGMVLRKSIRANLVRLRDREPNTNELVQNVTSLAREVELEIERANDQKEWYWMRRFHGDDSRP